MMYGASQFGAIAAWRAASAAAARGHRLRRRTAQSGFCSGAARRAAPPRCPLGRAARLRRRAPAAPCAPPTGSSVGAATPRGRMFFVAPVRRSLRTMLPSCDWP